MKHTDHIPAVTIRNVARLPFRRMLEGLEPYVLERVPEGLGMDTDAIQETDRLIGRFSNLYAYLMYLFSFIANEALLAKSLGDDDLYSSLVRKKEALYELARAVRYKHEACSRMITIAFNQAEEAMPFDRVDTKAREEAAARTRTQHRWGNVG